MFQNVAFALFYLLFTKSSFGELLQINCKKHNLKGVDCSNYIEVWLQAYHGETQNTGKYNDLPSFGYSSFIIPQDADVNGTQIVYSSQQNGTNGTLHSFTTLNVGLSAQVNNILGINQEAGTITVDMVLILTWFDSRLAWNTSIAQVLPDAVDDIMQVASQPTTLLPTSTVWTPDLNLVNGNQPFSSMFNWSPNIQLYSNGQIYLYGSGSLTANCILNLKKFPFDSQSCDFYFASKSNVIALGYNLSWFVSAPQIQTQVYKPSISWKVNGFSQSYEKRYLVSQFVTMGSTLAQLSSVLIFNVNLQRYTFYYIITGVVPNIGLALMAMVALLVPHPATQIGMLVTIILALVALGVSTNINIPFMYILSIYLY